MGVEYSGKLLVGGEYHDIAEVVDGYLENNPDEGWTEREAIEELGLAYASPYFDCSVQEDWVGFEFPDTPFTEGWYKAFEEAAVKWKELTGTGAKLMGVQDIW